ncbi:MAG: PEP-CTERM sorting domain-containing protein [Planctomycetota bacterium]
MVLGAFAAEVRADPLTFQLGNHPDGGARPPLYGFRLDGLFNDGGSSIYTFDFEAPGADMKLTVTPDGGGSGTVRIFGTAFGGLNAGNGYAADMNKVGLWEIDFTYVENVMIDGDLDVVVAPDSQMGAPGFNEGTIKKLTGPNIGETFYYVDEDGNKGFAFKFNNDDNHRLGGSGLSGPETWVGWGWVNHDDMAIGPNNIPGHVKASDWLFTGQPVPEPGTIALFGAAAAGFLVMRRRRKNVS